MSRYVFVGERPSPKAARYGHTWTNGKAAARTLHDTLRALGLDPDAQLYVNLWQTPGLRKPCEEPHVARVKALRRTAKAGLPLVALGSLVAKELERLGIPHRRMVHPAARGKIRKRERYVAHAREVLLTAGGSDA